MASLLSEYIEAGKEAGCPRDQIERFVKAGIVLQPKQLAFAAAARECDKPGGPTRIGYGGARGGGKSHVSVAQLFDDCDRVPGLKCLFLRKVLKGARESFGDLRLRVLRNVPNEYKKAEGIIEFPNGSKIVLGHFKSESDIDAYLGLEYDVICIEEATTLTPSKITAIGTCLRTSKQGWRPREYHTTNPGGVSHGNFKKTFIAPYRRNEETDTRFIPATVDDNGFVNPEYTAKLDALVGWQKKAWRYGDWDIAAGQFFSNWLEDVHVVSAEDFTIGKDWHVWASLDYGFTHYTACHLFCQDNDGNRYVVAEHGERKQLPKWHADRIKAMLERFGLTPQGLREFVAGHDVFAHKGGEKTIAQTYEENGIVLTPADIDRINGAGSILTGFGKPRPEPDEEAIPPKLFVLDSCTRLIETIPSLVHDPHRPEDVLKVDCDEDGEGGDDFYDSFRYGYMVERPKPSLPSTAPANRYAAVARK